MGVWIHEIWLAMLAIAFVVLTLSMVCTMNTNLKGNIASLKISGCVIMLLAYVMGLSIIFGGCPQTPTEKAFLQSFDWSPVKARGEQQLKVQVTMIFKDGKLVEIEPFEKTEQKEAKK